MKEIGKIKRIAFDAAEEIKQFLNQNEGRCEIHWNGIDVSFINDHEFFYYDNNREKVVRDMIDCRLWDFEGWIYC